jgi:hypothetical protein
VRHASVVVALVALGACGSETQHEEAAPATEFRIIVWPSGRGGEAMEARLTCDPAAGSHPRPSAACAVLARERGALDPVPPDAICTQEFGGPDEAEVTGTIEGARLEATFTKRNGCEIDRWERLEPLLALEQ